MKKIIDFNIIIEECLKNNKINYDDIKKYELTEEQFNDLLAYLNQIDVELYVDNEEEYRNRDIDLYTDDSTRQFLYEIGKYNLLTKEEEITLFKLYGQGNMNARKQLIESNLRLVVSIAKKRYMKKHESSIQFLDLCQEGAKGVMKAIDKFDIDKGYKFSTYATWWIDQQITRYMYGNDRTIRIPSYAREKVNKVKRFQYEFMEKNNRMPTVKEYLNELKITRKQLELYLDSALDIYSLEYLVNDGSDTTLKETIEEENSVENIVVDRETFKEFLERLKSILTEREMNIILHRNGFFDNKVYTLDEIGKKYNVTRERIRQIENKAYRKVRGTLKEQNSQNYR